MKSPTCKMCGRQFAIARWDNLRPHRSGMNEHLCRDCYNLPDPAHDPQSSPIDPLGPIPTETPMGGASFTLPAVNPSPSYPAMDVAGAAGENLNP